MLYRTRSARRYALTLLAAAAATSAAILPFSAPVVAAPAVTKIEGTAATAAGLTPTVNAYRTLVGDPNNASAPGSQATGRREINWDGTPDAQSAPSLLPPDFFNTTVPRGAVFSTIWGPNKFQVSADSANPAQAPVRFGNLNASYPATFGTFSAERLFTPLGTNTMRINFFVPGTTMPATVNGFGAVFTDVDRADSTKVELYDRWGNRLWWQNVLKGPVAHKSLSFLGVTTSADIYEVRITTGNAPLHANNRDGVNGLDLVVMDDFLYGEPKPLH